MTALAFVPPFTERALPAILPHVIYAAGCNSFELSAAVHLTAEDIWAELEKLSPEFRGEVWSGVRFAWIGNRNGRRYWRVTRRRECFT